VFNVSTFSANDLRFDLSSHSRDTSDRFTVLIGPNGCGKSQLLRRLAEHYSDPDARLSEAHSPRTVLAISNLVSDVFPFGSVTNSLRTPTYRYLGLRQAANNMTTGSLHDSIANFFIELECDDRPISTLAPVLTELGFSDWRISLRRTKTSQTDSPVRFLHTEFDKLRINRPSSVVNKISDLIRAFANTDLDRDGDGRESFVELIRSIHQDFDLAPSLSIRLVRRIGSIGMDIAFLERQQWRPVRSLSAGQAMLISMVARVAATITRESIVLIDEPETGLHPNWQSSFIPLLRSAIPMGSGSHFFIATHSPYLVGEASDVLVPGQSWGRFVEFDDPFQGRSVENILYRVFNARVAGNTMVESDLTVVITALADPTTRFSPGSTAAEAVTRLRRISSSDTRTLNEVLTEVDARRGGNR
jgi:predicted ATPase